MIADKDIKREITRLISIQEIDSQIYDFTSKKESFPVRIKEMDDSLEGKKTGLNAAEDALRKIQVEKNEKEVDIKSREEKIRKHEAELYQIKNNKEYKVLQDEIASIKADISLLEEQVIKYYDDIDAAQKQVEEEKRRFEEQKQAVEAEKHAIKDEERELDSRLAELKSMREEKAEQVDPEVFSAYERILKGKGRVALARVKGEFCAECNMHLRPQLIDNARLQKNLVLCENCGRMLYVPED